MLKANYSDLVLVLGHDFTEAPALTIIVRIETSRHDLRLLMPQMKQQPTKAAIQRVQAAQKDFSTSVEFDMRSRL